MTTGHKHRTLTLDLDSRWHRLVYRFLEMRIARTTFTERAELSRFVWRGNPNPEGYYELRVLGVLHALCGLTVVHADNDPRANRRL